MTDNRTDDDLPPLEHDEFHSALEIDDSSGWRVFVVPGLALLFVIGAILFIVLYQGDAEPDPRIANRLKQPEQAEVAQTATPAAEPAATTEATP